MLFSTKYKSFLFDVIVWLKLSLANSLCLGLILFDQGLFSDAEFQYKESLRIKEKVSGDSLPLKNSSNSEAINQKDFDSLIKS